MFNKISDDIYARLTNFIPMYDMFAMFCTNKEHSNRSQEILDRKYRTYRIERATLHRFHWAVQAIIDNWRIEKQRRISIPMYNNNRRLRNDDTPVLMF
tara:strand:+ start:626 stop:919 length:294 start_codon:yes stop_codon:yes gene_type:complete